MLTENYRVGESVLLTFELKELNGSYELLDASFDLSVNGKEIAHREQATVMGKNIIIMFSPLQAGRHILDVWFHINSMDSNVSVVSEYRTARFYLPVEE